MKEIVRKQMPAILFYFFLDGKDACASRDAYKIKKGTLTLVFSLFNILWK